MMAMNGKTINVIIVEPQIAISVNLGLKNHQEAIFAQPAIVLTDMSQVDSFVYLEM